METKTTAIARINNVEIVMIENGDKRIAIKPICDALGIAFEPQFTRLKTDPILRSTVMLSVTVGADGKQREMLTIPFKIVSTIFGKKLRNHRGFFIVLSLAALLR